LNPIIDVIGTYRNIMAAIYDMPLRFRFVKGTIIVAMTTSAIDRTYLSAERLSRIGVIGSAVNAGAT